MLWAWHRAPADELVQKMVHHDKAHRHDGVVDAILLAALDSDLVVCREVAKHKTKPSSGARWERWKRPGERADTWERMHRAQEDGVMGRREAEEAQQGEATLVSSKRGEGGTSALVKQKVPSSCRWR